MNRSTAIKSFMPTPASFLLQRRCACGGSSRLAGHCHACSKTSGERRSSSEPQQQTVPAPVHEVLRSSGQPLDRSTRSFFEPRFGHDFSRVRVHADEQAAQSARAVNASAYTVGRDVVFGAGQYAPGTSPGRKLLAHELAHVVQQDGSTVPIPMGLSQIGEPLETEADRVADAVVAGHDRLGVRRPLGRASATRLMRAIAYGADCQPNQKEVEGNVSRAQASAGRWIRAALTSLTSPERIGSLLRRHFNIEANNAAATGQIRSQFEHILGDLDADAFTYHCRPDSDARCQSADGGNVKGFAYAGRPDIFFCDPYPFQNFFGHKSLIDTLLHEAAHAHDASFNHDTYEWQDAYPGRRPLTNADSYASFAREAALGRGGANLELTVGSLLAAEPQFYIAAGLSGEVGGPALDLFNLKLGYRIAYLHGTGRQPRRAFQAGEIGLRINPIGKRVYVDVTTGAFLGQNFTDNELMAGIANRLSAGYRGERADLGLDLEHLRDFVADQDLVIVGVRTAVRF